MIILVFLIRTTIFHCSLANKNNGQIFNQRKAAKTHENQSHMSLSKRLYLNNRHITAKS